MSNNRKLIVEIVGDSSKLDRTFRGVETRSQKFANKVTGKTGLGGGLLGGVSKGGVIGASVAAGAGAALVGIKKVTDAAKDAQVAQAGLNQAFAATGVASAKLRKEVDSTIQSVSKRAGIDDEEVSRNLANLLRTTGSVVKARRDVALAADIARARNISLAAASKVVEKAENGQLRGLKALGVQIDKNTTSSEAIDRAQRKFAGSAEAYGRTAQGAQDKLSVSFENLEERLGTKLLPIITKLSLKLIDFIDWSEKNWPRFAKAVGDAYRAAKPFIDNTLATIKAIVAVFEGVVKTINAIANGDWSRAWAGIKQAAVAQLDLIYHAFLELPLKITRALAGKGLDALEAVGRAIGNAIRRGVFAIINKMIDDLNSVGGLLNKALPGNPIPKLGHVGGTTAATPRPSPVVRSERQLSSVTINVNGAGDPDRVAAVVLRKLQTNNRLGSPQGRGRAPGAWTGLH